MKQSIVSKTHLLSFTLVLSVASAFGQETAIDEVSRRAADLEGQARKLDSSSVEGANTLLELVDLYHKNARAFGLIRAGKAFVKVHRDHPRHKEVMLKLLDGHLIVSRNEDIVSTARQFLEFYPKDAKAPQVARELGEVLQHQNKKMEAAKAFERAWRLSGMKDAKSGFRAVKLFGESGAEGARECGRLALEMLNKTNGTLARELGNHAFDKCTVRDWDRKGAIAIGEKLIQRKLIPEPKRRAEIHKKIGGYLWHTGQRANAVTHYRRAWEQQRDGVEYLRDLIVHTYESGTKAAQLKPLVDEYKRRIPQNADGRGEVLSNLANAYARAKQ